MNPARMMLWNELGESMINPGVKESARNLLSALKGNAEEIMADPAKRKAALGIAGLTAGVGAIGSMGDDDNGYGGRRGPYKVEYY